MPQAHELPPFTRVVEQSIHDAVVAELKDVGARLDALVNRFIEVGEELNQAKAEILLLLVSKPPVRMSDNEYLNWQDTRLAEIVFELDDYKVRFEQLHETNKVINNQVTELTADLKVADRASLELTAELASLRAALQEAITHMYSDATVKELSVARENARNALKDTP